MKPSMIIDIARGPGDEEEDDLPPDDDDEAAPTRDPEELFGAIERQLAELRRAVL
jgi:hypothetical protein